MADIQSGSNPGTVPARTQAEFTPQALSAEDKQSLDALEEQINGSTVAPPEPTIEPVVNESIPIPELETPVEPVGVPVPEGTHVPPKFQTPEGNLDQAKVEKSLSDLNAYLEAEKQLSAKRSGQAQPDTNFQPPASVPTSPDQNFFQQVEQGLKTNPTQTIINLMQAASQSAQQQAQGNVRNVEMKMELMEIAKNDPGVFTSEGLQKLTKIREENPWLDSSPTPWRNAYKLSGGKLSETPVPSSPQTRTPAPIMGGGQQPPKVSASAPLPTSPEEVKSYLKNKTKNLPVDQQAKAEYELLERIMAQRTKR